MKKWTILLAFLLCAAMLLPAAAQEAYVPGQTAKALVSSALENGRMIRGDMTLRLNADAAALGLSGDEAAILDAISTLLGSVTLSGAAGRTEDGVRIELAAELAHAQGGLPVAVDAAANLSLTGISLESSLLEGRRVTSRWETLLAMAGMSDGDIMMLLSLRDMDWAAMLPQLLSLASEYMDVALQTLAPYADLAVSWASSLSMETIEDVEPAEGYPEAATELNIIITQQDIGRLLSAFAAQVKADEGLCGLLDMCIQSAYTDGGEVPTAAQICDEITNTAARMTDTESPLLIDVGFDGNGMPIYALLYLFSGESCIGYADLMFYPGSDGLHEYSLTMLTFDEAGEVESGMLFIGAVGDGVFTLESEVYAAGETVMALIYAVDSAAAEDGQPGLVITQNASFAADDGTQYMEGRMNATSKSSLLEDGGELMDEVMMMEIAIGEDTIPMTALQTLILYPTPEGFAGSYSTTQSMPAAGVNTLGMDVRLSSPMYDAAATAALRETAFETSSREDINALLDALTSAAQLTLLEASQALPPELIALMTGE